MTVTLPDEFQSFLDTQEDASAELRLRLAAHFYSLGKVGVSGAAKLAGRQRGEFERWLKDHDVPMPWTDEDLKTELSWIVPSSDCP